MKLIRVIQNLKKDTTSTTGIYPGFVPFALPTKTISVTNYHYHIPQCLKLQPSQPNYLTNYT